MLILTALLAAPVAVTEPAPKPKLPPAPHLHAARTTTPPVLDGKIDDDVWKLAPPGTGFVQKVPNDGHAPSDPTTVRVLYDDDNVYVAFDCPQTHTPMVKHLTRRDREVEADAVWFDLGTRGDHKSSFEFYVSSSGTLADAIRFNDTDYSASWDENWDARTDVTEQGWTAEFRIPLRVLRFPTRSLQSWDFQAARYVSNRQEQDYWAYFPRDEGGEVSHYGRLDDLRNLHERAPIELRPFVIGRFRRRDSDPNAAGSGLPTASGTDFLGSAGLDVKWHPTQDLTLDATFNPDFAQVEADQVVLNLTTVETYYPEKRPFFLEGIDTFSTPFQLLYTRRIGRVPPLPALRTDSVNNETLVDSPEPAMIYGATKLTGRLGGDWSVGTIQAVTAPNGVKVQVNRAAPTSRVIDPTSTFNVLRLKRDLGDNAHIAFTGTAVTRAESTGDYPLLLPSAGYPVPSELCPDPIQLTPLQQRSNFEPAPRARCFNDAYVGAIDWRWRSPGGEFTTGGQVATSVLQNGPDRPIADGTLEHPGNAGVAAQAYLNKEGGKHVVGGLHTDLESRKFDINDLGYNGRANQLEGDGYVEYRQLDPWGPFLEAHANVYFGTQYNSSGLLIGQGTHLNSYGHFKNFWWFSNDFYYRGTKFDDREVGDGSALQRQGAVGHDTSISTDSTKRVSLSVEEQTERVWDGVYLTGNADLTVRALAQLDFDLMPTWQWAQGEPRFVSSGPANGQYLFGHLLAKSAGLTLRATYTFLPRLTLQGYAQLFLASGHYSQFSQYQSNPSGPRPAIQVSDLSPYSGYVAPPDFEQGVLNINMVLRWEYRLGSTLYLVYTHSQTPTALLDPTQVGTLDLGAVGRAPASDVILAKLSFWWGG